MAKDIFPSSASTNPTLTVYKASAGSGKTFTLAVEYIKLLINNPWAYEGILAVTFTNKATEEMKMRILSQLYGLWKQLPSSEGYMKEVTTSLQLSEKQVSENARRALHNLLHNYHFFKVQTIDTFFQSVLRNLARELQLNANLRVGLNTKEVVSEAVDSLIDSIPDDAELMKSIMGYIEYNMDEKGRWNITSNIKKFGTTIFEETYKMKRKELNDVLRNPDFINDFRKQLILKVKQLRKHYISLGTKMLQLCVNAEKNTTGESIEVDDFARKSTGPIGYFVKLSKGLFDADDFFTSTMQNAMDDATKWYTKTSKKKEAISLLAERHLMPTMRETEEQRMKDVIFCKSAHLTLSHLDDLSLLHKIEESAHDLNEASQRFMLSDTQSMLHEIIGENDSPFIFEKIGAYLEHVMIDEFQDTSTIQWANFKTLLRDCMSHGNQNLIVGDVKQSIYRFRSGDWRLLNDIDKEFSEGEIDHQPKKTNWRSCRNVINFNNTILRLIADLEVEALAELDAEKAASLKKAYADVEQLIPDNHAGTTGLVHIDMLPSQKLTDDMNALMQQKTFELIKDLVDKGIPQKDIAILMRKKKQIPTLAKFIEEESDGLIHIVSAEAFRLDASLAVRIVINAMRIILNPSDMLSEMALRHDLATDIPLLFTNYTKELSALSLHDLAERLIGIFRLDEMTDQGAYLTAFFDSLQKFSTEKSPLLEDFLEAWDDDISSKTIEAAESDGVRILTIHKSKGLEFSHVILPYFNWNGDPEVATTIWTTPTQEPFSKLPVIPVDYKSSKSFENTVFEPFGHEEYVQNVVDNLNLLYVAMTRACHSLFIIGENTTDKFNRSQMLSKAIELLPSEIDGQEVHIHEYEKDDAKAIEVIYGSLPITKSAHEESSESANVFEPNVTNIPVAFRSVESTAEFRQSNDSRRFADDSIDETDRQRYIRMGTVMHQVFSLINTLDDLEPTLRRMEFDGTLYGEDMTHQQIVNDIMDKFKDPQVADWFSPRWKVYNECTIITPSGEHRPDRVITDGSETIVIDFKFGVPHDPYRAQVLDYMHLLQKMNMPNVRGYLWYVSLNKIVEIK